MKAFLIILLSITTLLLFAISAFLKMGSPKGISGYKSDDKPTPLVGG